MRRAALESTMNEAKNSTMNSNEMVAIPLVKLDNLIAAVEQLKSGKLRPFMYNIQGADLRPLLSAHRPI